MEWLTQLYALVPSDSQGALDLAFQKLLELQREGNFTMCDCVLSQIEVERLDENLMVGILSATLFAKSKMLAREHFFQRIETHLATTNTDVEAIIGGLR